MLQRILRFIHYNKIEYSLLVIAIAGFIAEKHIVPSVFTLVAFVTFVYRKYISGTDIDYRHRVYDEFKEVSPNGRGYINLKYTNDIPILTLHYDVVDEEYEYTLGYMQGKYLHKYIKKLVDKFKWFDRGMDMFYDMGKVEVAENYKKELQGIVDGYNSVSSTSITYMQLLHIHMLPECTNVRKKPMETISDKPLGCTVITETDINGVTTMARNMDWCPFGDLATNTLVVYYTKSKVYSLTIPGIIGVITGWNESGLCLAMNVSRGYNNKGTPSVFYNRWILDNYANVYSYVTDRRRIDWYDKEVISPLGSYHINIIDKYGGKQHIEFNITSDVKTYKHYYEGDGQDLIMTFNDHSVHENGSIYVLSGWDSRVRERIVRSMLEDGATLDNILSAVPINNNETCHSVIFMPSENKVGLAWNNGFAGDAVKTYIQLGVVFEGK